jgi:hypothetical protein
MPNNYGNIQSFIAGEALEPYRCVKLDSTINQVVHTTAITDMVIGVTLEKVAAGEAVSVAVGSGMKVKVRTSAAVALGAQLMPADSEAGRVATAAGATAVCCGIALSVSDADEETIDMLTRFMIDSPAVA